MSLRKIATTALLSTVLAGSAFAGGPDNITIDPGYTSFAGQYIGIDLGGAWANEAYTFNALRDINSTPFQPLAGGSLSQTLAGFVGGVFAGQNWQRNAWVWGYEFGFDGSTMSNTVQNSFTNPSPFNVVQTENKVSMNWLMTLVPRLGYVCHNFLFYGKLGGGLTNLQSQITTNSAVIDPVDDENQYALGLDVGAGADYKIGQWLLGLSYDFLYFGTTNFAASSSVSALDYGLNSKVNVIKARVGYQFNI